MFGKDTLVASEVGTDGLTVTGNQPTGTTDQTDQRDVEQSSDVDSNENLTPVDVATPTVNSQGHDISSRLPHRYYDGRHTDKLRSIDRLLKGRDIKGQRFYLVKCGIREIPTEWLAAKDVPTEIIEAFHKRCNMTGHRRKTNIKYRGRLN